MLSEIAADVLHFLARRDLDKACGISKWLDALISQCCEVYPLRRVPSVLLYRCYDLTPTIVIKKDDAALIDHSFGSMEEAAHFAASILRSSYVEVLEVSFNISLAASHEKRSSVHYAAYVVTCLRG